MILLLGVLGQLGRDLFPLIPEPKLGWSRGDLDVTQFDTVRDRLLAVRPKVVINCTAYNFVDRAETESQLALLNNSWAVENLAKVCAEIEATLVHFSTDYVFGAETNDFKPWREVDNPRPSSAYGASKLKGEWGIRGAGLNYFILRTCGLYGLHGVGGKGGNFVETMLRVAGQGKPLRVVNDQRCTPSSTQDVARATLQLLETKQYGLYHLTNSGDCSWYEFAAEIFRLSGLSPSLTAIPTVDYPTPAKRPEYSVLDLSQLTSVGVARPRPWQEALAEYLSKRRTG